MPSTLSSSKFSSPTFSSWAGVKFATEVGRNGKSLLIWHGASTRHEFRKFGQPTYRSSTHGGQIHRYHIHSLSSWESSEAYICAFISLIAEIRQTSSTLWDRKPRNRPSDYRTTDFPPNIWLVFRQQYISLTWHKQPRDLFPLQTGSSFETILGKS